MVNINNDVIDRLYSDFENLHRFLIDKKEIDYANFLEDSFRKNLLIASASFIEDAIQQILIDFFKSSTKDEIIVNFLEKKAISRQYHTYFDWNSSNVNSFLRLFGKEFKNKFDSQKNEKIENYIKSFIELGRLRNELVHKNFINYTLEKTTKEIKELFDNSYQFTIFFQESLNNST